jgi:kynureninase
MRDDVGAVGSGSGAARALEGGDDGVVIRYGGGLVEAGQSAAYAVVQALVARGVIGDFRAGDGKCQADIMRFGFTPLYIGFEDVWHAVAHLRDVLHTGAWRAPQFMQKHTVT